MEKNKITNQFKSPKEALKHFFDHKNYAGMGSYIKTLSTVLVNTIVVAIALLWLMSYAVNHSAVTKKVENHQAMIREGKKRLANDFERKERDLKTQMRPILEKGGDERIAIEEMFEYRKIHEKRAEDQRRLKKEREINDVLDVLQGRKSIKDVEHYYYILDSLHQSCSRCHELLKDEVFSLRSRLIAKKSLAEKYIADIARLESLSELNFLDQAELNKKKAYVEEAAKIDIDASDAVLARFIKADENDPRIAYCYKIAKKAIPILVKYDDSHGFVLYLKDIKLSADYLGVDDVDWTVPLMVYQEKKDYDKIQLTKDALEFIDMMNRKYEALGDNPGFNYPIYSKFRQEGGISHRYLKENDSKAVLAKNLTNIN